MQETDWFIAMLDARVLCNTWKIARPKKHARVSLYNSTSSFFRKSPPRDENPRGGSYQSPRQKGFVHLRAGVRHYLSVAASARPVAAPRTSGLVPATMLPAAVLAAALAAAVPAAAAAAAAPVPAARPTRTQD